MFLQLRGWYLVLSRGLKSELTVVWTRSVLFVLAR
jgi:hypothetical protein